MSHASEGSQIIFIVRNDGNTFRSVLPDLRYYLAGIQRIWQTTACMPIRNMPTRLATTARLRPAQTPTEDNLFNAEYPMLRWLERNGYDVSYSTDLDTDIAWRRTAKSQGLFVCRP